MNRAERRRVTSLERRGKLRYIKNDVFKGEVALKVSDPDAEPPVAEHEASVAEAFKTVLGVYVPNAQARQVLIGEQIVAFNDVMHKLADAALGDWLLLEKHEFDVLKSVVDWTSPTLSTLGRRELSQLWRNTPALVKLIADAPDKAPEGADAEVKATPEASPNGRELAGAAKSRRR